MFKALLAHAMALVHPLTDHLRRQFQWPHADWTHAIRGGVCIPKQENRLRVEEVRLRSVDDSAMIIRLASRSGEDSASPTAW